MNTADLIELGTNRANSLLAENQKTMHIAICENCSETTNTFKCDTDEILCLSCWIMDMREWEQRLSSASEYVFLDKLGEIPNDETETYKIVMNAFWFQLEKAGK